MKPRVTVSVTADGQFELWLNLEGRDLLVRQLQRLSESDDHLHLSPDAFADIETSKRAYQPGDTVLEYGKIYLRLDEWDREFFPHVMEKDI